jgi:hypothetical protein
MHCTRCADGAGTVVSGDERAAGGAAWGAGGATWVTCGASGTVVTPTVGGAAGVCCNQTIRGFEQFQPMFCTLAPQCRSEAGPGRFRCCRQQGLKMRERIS